MGTAPTNDDKFGEDTVRSNPDAGGSPDKGTNEAPAEVPADEVEIGSDDVGDVGDVIDDLNEEPIEGDDEEETD